MKLANATAGVSGEMENARGAGMDRRTFLTGAIAALGSAELATLDSAYAQTGKAKSAESPAVKQGTNASFGPLKRIDAGVLSVGYA
ncbi:MAG TPA: hypothetical protein VHL99_10060, partial [Candidatus Binatia bacterium]|nr:hypothetical protein [Candidatus Binatia bacterium]